MTNDELVPFGKYKGRSVVELIADRPYVDWLTAQSWFRERYGTVHNIVVANHEPQDSPEHNIMQARYLDHNECLRLCVMWLASEEELRVKLRKYADKLTKSQMSNFIGADFGVSVTGLVFEYEGWDVVVSATAHLSVKEKDTKLECHCVCSKDCETQHRATLLDNPHSSA